MEASNIEITIAADKIPYLENEFKDRIIFNTYGEEFETITITDFQTSDIVKIFAAGWEKGIDDMKTIAKKVIQ